MLFILDLVRGHHSSGIATVNAKRETKLLKDIGTPFDLLKDNKFNDTIKGDLNVMMCHNRAATRGSVKPENAHPFHQGHIIGAHNGTIHSAHRMERGSSFEVDSQAIFNNIAHEGVLETIKKTNGAYALTWYDEQLHTFNIARNKERPLSFCFSKDMKTMFYASEPWMLWAALGRNQVDHYKVSDIDPLKHYVLDVPAAESGKCGRFNQWQQHDLPEYEHPKYHGGTPFVGGARNEYRQHNVYRHGEDWEDLEREQSVVQIVDRVINNQNKDTSLTFARVSSHLNKEITVTTSFAVTEGNQDYIRCMFDDGSGLEPIVVRCHCSRRGDLFNQMASPGKKYTLKAKSCNSVSVDGKNRYYLVADIRSIQHVAIPLLPIPVNVNVSARQVARDSCPNITEMAESIAEAMQEQQRKILSENGGKPLEERYYETYRKELMKGADILRLSKQCTWCSNPPNLVRANNFVWIAANEHVCDSCVHDPEVKYYLENAG